MTSQTVGVNSFPKFLRSEPSPKIQDSAFPPFKIEHRYRGVYERAGFDVNLGSDKKRQPSPTHSTLHSQNGNYGGAYGGSQGRGAPYGSSHSHGSSHSYGSTHSHGNDQLVYENRHVRNTNGSSESQGSLTHNRQRLQQLMHSYKSRLQRLLPTERALDNAAQNRPYASSGDLPGAYPRHLPTRSMALLHLAPLVRLDRLHRTNQLGQILSSQQNLQYQPSEQYTDHGYSQYSVPQSEQYPGQHAQNQYVQPETAYQSLEPAPMHQPGPQDQQFDPRKGARATRKNSQRTEAERQPQAFQVGPTIEESVPFPFPQHSNDSSASVLSVSAVVGGAGNLAVVPNAQNTPYPTGPNLYNDESGHSTYVFSEPPHTSLSTAYTTNLNHLNYNSKHDSFDFSPRQDQARNFKALLLDLNDPVDMEPLQNNSLYETQEQPHERSRLSNDFEDLRRDVEDHRNYNPKSPPLSNAPRQPPQLPASSPTALGLARFEPYNSPVPAIVTTMEDGTHERDSMDYENFLQNNKLAPRQSTARHSQFSTVSSIISKDDRDQYTPDDNESEDEVERELERQLKSLTVGDDAENSPKLPQKGAENAGANNGANDRIDGLVGGSGYQQDAEDSATVDSRRLSIQPLKSERIRSIQSEVKPLSPKTHQVDEELRAINLGNRDQRFPERLESEREVAESHPNEHHETEQSYNDHEHVNAPPVDQAQNRESVTGKYSPGRGPCRGCNQPIDAHASGANKAVFSKTGELGGQWHRKCFSCAHLECSVHFNKTVPCYAFSDRPYCNHHYHEVNNSLCTECGSGIEGECIENELEQKWHTSCLKCTQCNLTIRSDYYLINGTTYCENDALAIILGEAYSDPNGNMRGLSTSDRIEKRRTRMMYVEL